MADRLSLKLESRTAAGKKLAALRKDGFVPGVVYGGQAEPYSVQSAFVETNKIVQAAGKHAPIDLIVDGKKKLAIIKSIDIDPVKHLLRHVAFHTIKQNEKITTEVAIILVGEGESVAERAGLVVLQALDKIEVKAFPANLPDSLELSILDLASTEDKLTIADIKLPEGVEYDDIDQDLSLVVANVYEPSALQAANEAAGGDAEAVVEDVATDNGEVEAPKPDDEK